MQTSEIPAAAVVPDSDSPLTRTQAEQMIAQAIASLRIYVVESDITEAQNAHRVIVEQATF